MTTTGLADLHRHLDGSLREETLRELAAAAGQAIPDPLVFSPHMGIDAALARFAFTLSLLQSADPVRRVADEICQDAQREGVSSLEIRFAPQLHHGASLEEIVDAALEGIARRAGLILCGLYGEPPAILERLVEVGRVRPGVVGIDLAGAPLPVHRWRMEDYQSAYQNARTHGLGRTVHAGEGRPPAEIRYAIEKLGAQRVGHGTTLLEDPAVVDQVVRQGVTIEACVTSNHHTGAISTPSAHPLLQWLAAGVRVCVCTDNTLFSAVDAPEEYQRIARLPGMTAAKMDQVIGFGHEAAFSRPDHAR